MKPIFAVSLAVLAATILPVPVQAQGAIALGERPIARTEVTAFVKKQFAQMDTNRDGHVSPTEFEGYRARQGDRSQTGLGHIGRRWFEKTDANYDGKVTQAEAVARPLEIFDMADMDRDGIASVREQSLAQIFMGN